MSELQAENVEYTEQDALLEEAKDVALKLNSIIENLENDKELDETQKGFLQMHNIK